MSENILRDAAGDSYEQLTTDVLALRRRLLVLMDREERTNVTWYIARRAVVHLYDAFNALLELEHEIGRQKRPSV